MKLKISVLKLVKCVLRSGDLVSTYKVASRKVEGARAHRKIQKKSSDEYIPEVHIFHLIKKKDFHLEVSGIIDGVIEKDGHLTIDEIKTTTKKLKQITENDYPQHWAQAKCYAYIYAVQNMKKEKKRARPLYLIWKR